MINDFRERDVAGVDVNMGCPKDFSLKVSSESHSHNFIIAILKPTIPSSQV